MAPVPERLTDGLAGTVAHQRARSLDVTVRFAPGTPVPALSAPVIEAVVGSVDEALTNVAKHSGVRCATVEVSCEQGELSVSVADRGRGFDASGEPAAPVRDTALDRRPDGGYRRPW